MGYVLYRTSKGRSAIVHLCIDPQHRGGGLARLLIDALAERTRHLAGITVRCRRDFDAWPMWQRLGFVVHGEVPARAKGKMIGLLRRDHGHPDLFNWRAHAGQEEARLIAAIDMNIFLDLHGGAGFHRDEVSASLLAEWLADEIELAITGELLNEIDRVGNDVAERRTLRAEADGYRHLACDADAVGALEVSLLCLLPSQDASAASDVRHLAGAIAARADIFVTRDDALLNVSNELYSAHGLSVLRPEQLVAMIDAVQREHFYQPARFGRTLSRVRPLSSTDDLRSLASRFCRTHRGEKPQAVVQLLQRLLSDPRAFGHLVVVDVGGETQALLGWDLRDSSFRILVFREPLDAGSSTGARAMADHLLRSAIEARNERVEINDPHMSEAAIEAVVDAGFVETNDGWLKLNRFEVLSMREAEVTLAGLGGAPSEGRAAAIVERHLRPLKVWDAPLDCFVVPVRPEWAADLFDDNLAAERLFEAPLKLGLRTECVYYRSARPTNRRLRGPARVLWYVSGGQGIVGEKSVRAYSQIEEVFVGPPKEVFRRFRRFGAYEWEDVFEIAGRDLAGAVMAIRFRDTELFKNPVVVAHVLPRDFGPDCLAR